MDTTTPNPETTEQPVEEVQPTLAEHEAQYGAGARAEAVDEPPAESTPLPPRAKDGTFKRPRHRAASQQASPGDVPRIKALTAQKNESEATAAARIAALEAEVATLKAPKAQPATPAPTAARPVARADAKPTSDDPEPQYTDPKYGGDGVKYLQDHTRWAVRDEHRKIRDGETQAQTTAKKQQEYESLRQAHSKRIDAARAKYPDFQAVALDGPSGIPEGTAVDAFLMEDDAGMEILYHLKRHPEELDALLRMPVMAQVKTLSLLSQRLVSPPSTAAGLTTAAPGPKMVVLPPKPPTVVRTEAQRAPDGPPTDRDLTLAEHEQHYGRRRR